MNRPQSEDFLEIVRKSRVALNENKEEWAKYFRVTEYFKKNGFKLEQDANDPNVANYTKTLSEPPYSKVVTVTLKAGVFEVVVAKTEPGNSKTFGDTFSEEKELVTYLDKVVTGQISEEVKKDWGDAYNKLFKQQLKTTQGSKKASAGKTKKGKKKAKTDEKGKTGSYGKGYRGYWGANMQDMSNMSDTGTGDVGTSNGDGE
jgi:hypothetical protein